MQLHILNQNPDSVIAPCFKVEPQSDGFYPLTSFECLYKGLQSLFDNNEFDDGKQGENTLIYLFSDAKPVDSKTYENVFETMQNYPSYKNAAKYIAFVDEKEDKYNKHTIKFVDYKAEKIIQMIDIPGEISKLQMTFFSNFSSPDENERYDRIFI